MIRKAIRWWVNHTSLFVILDGGDNSVTLSRRLFRKMQVMRQDAAKVFVFAIPADATYGFTLNPAIEGDDPAQLCDIQYNERYRCIGFETLVPTVNRILYDYGLPSGIKCRLSVSQHRLNNLTYYKIHKPHGLHSNRHA